MHKGHRTLSENKIYLQEFLIYDKPAEMLKNSTVSI